MAFALTEPEAGSDPSSMTSQYEDTGESYLLSRKKHWIGNGTIADILTTYARDKTTGKISAFIVDMNPSGIRKKEVKNKMGLLTIKNAEIYFEGCRIPKQNLLGQLDQGLNIAYSALIDRRLCCRNREFKHGYYVEFTIVEGLPTRHPLLKKQLLVPILCITEYDKFENAIKMTNQSEYGLTSRIYSNKKEEISKFIQDIEAGVVYVNRKKSSTNRCNGGTPIIWRLEALWNYWKRYRCKILPYAIYERTKSNYCQIDFL
ncbi:MAG TPA: aldehyde dehydrogenase family protein [Nitrososphaeraceae archaeon]|jgi:hypothetical protein|nr:aldehyde dehydrogenase family protein [Nitrososphaeraceae archaeon]